MCTSPVYLLMGEHLHLPQRLVLACPVYSWGKVLPGTLLFSCQVYAGDGGS